jgi:hypothetical protein
MSRSKPLESPPTTTSTALYSLPPDSPAAMLRDRRSTQGRYDSTLSRSSGAAQDVPGAIPDVVFFSHLLIASGDGERASHGFGADTTPAIKLDEGLPAPLLDELLQQLPVHAEGPFELSLLLPTLGRVQVNAERSDNRWRIQLGFNRRDRLLRLQQHGDACREALERGLGHPVEVHLYQVAVA